MAEERKLELKKFLRAMRARLEPGDVGLPPLQRRRRAPGLRIEEAAALAGVSLTWYSAFEGGKDIRVSEDVLERVAQSLKLSAAERHYFNTLAKPGRKTTDESEPDAGAAFEQSTIDGFTHGPAFVADGFWNVYAYNAIADALYGFRASTEANLLVRMFTEPALRALHIEWARIAIQMTEIFHDAYANAVNDVNITALLARLREHEPFVGWWEAYGVRPFLPTSATLESPEVGRLNLTYVSFVEAPGRRVPVGRVLVLQIARDESTAKRLRRLAHRPS